MGRTLSVATALLIASALAACSGGEPDPEAAAATPAGFTLPEGVTLSKPAMTLDPGQAATVVVEGGGDGAASAVTTKVTEISPGDIKDFGSFRLDAASRAATPYYVKATVTNRGPDSLKGTSAPFVAHDDANVVYPPNVITGPFKPCEGGTLPEKFESGDSAEVCLVFLVPKGRTLVSIDADSRKPADAVRWKV